MSHLLEKVKILRHNFLIIGFLTISHTVLSQVYVIKNDSVFYFDQHLKEADAKSFEVHAYDSSFSFDDKTVYYLGKKTELDLASLKLFDEKDYFRDKNDVYMLQTKSLNSNEKNIVKLHSKSPLSFRKLSKNIYTDQELVYWDLKPLNSSDAKTLKILDNDFYFDQNYVYLQDIRLPLSSQGLKKFWHYNENDLDFVGSNGKICNDYGHCYAMDIATTTVINTNYLKDKEKVFCRNVEMTADPESFTLPVENLDWFARDKNFDFYLNGAFPERVPEQYQTSNKLTEYKNKIEEQIKSAFRSSLVIDIRENEGAETIYTFPKSGNTLIKKGKYISMNDKILPYIDAGSFKIFNNDLAVDKNKIYLIYEYSDYVTFFPIKNLTSKSFKYLDGGYFKVGKHTYYLGSVLNTEPKGKVTILDSKKNFAQDDDNVYYKNNIFRGLKPEKNAVLKEIADNYYTYNNTLFYLDYFDNDIKILENVELRDFESLINSYSRFTNKLYFVNKFVTTLEKEEKIISNQNEEKLYDLGGFEKSALLTSSKRLFIYGIEIKDLNNFEILDKYDNDYFKYNNRIYYEGNLIAECTDCRFSKLIEGREYYILDKKILFKGKFLDQTMVDDIFYNPKNTSWLVLKDNRAFYKDTLFYVDSKTFENLDFYLAKDKNFVYDKHTKTKFDATTFRYFANYSGSFTSDKNGVYYDQKKIEGADPATFQIFTNSDKIGFDKKYYFYEDQKILRSQIKLNE